MRHSITILALFISSACSISSTTSQQKAADQSDRWSRQIENFPPPTVNTNNGDWIPINPTTGGGQPDRSNNGRVLTFGAQPVFAPQQQSQQVFPPPPQFLQQTQFIPPTFPGNDLITNGPIPQQQNQFQTLINDHRFAIPNGQFIQQHHGPPPPPPPPQSRPGVKVTTPFQFEYNQQPKNQQPVFQQIPPQFLNDQFFEIPEKRPIQKPSPQKQSLQDPFKFESKFQNEKHQQPQHIQPPELLHHPPPPPPQQQIQHPKPQQVQQPHEEVQLLYVPLETYYQQQQQQQQQQQSQGNLYNNGLPQFVNPAHINDFYTPSPVRPLQIKTTTPAPQTTQAPRKPKPHQPPLAMFMLTDSKKSSSREATVNDILVTLKKEKSIAVLDNVPEESPNIFIGPSGLKTPSGYNKFELPYLSTIDNNRSERKLDNVPFFVAPLSYRAPDGFTKIPLPSPHVGSVVLNEHQMLQSISPPPPVTTVRPEVVTPFTRKYNSNFLSATPLPQKFDPLTMKYITPVTENPFKYNQEPSRQAPKSKPEKPLKQALTYEKPNEQRFEQFGGHLDNNRQVVNEEYFNFQKSPKKPQYSNNLDASFNEQRNSFNQFQQSIDNQNSNIFSQNFNQPTETYKTSAKPKDQNTESDFINHSQPSTANPPTVSFSRGPNMVENYQFSTPSSVIQKNQYHNDQFHFSNPTAQPYFEDVNQFYNAKEQSTPTKKPRTKSSQKSSIKFDNVKSVAPVEIVSEEPAPTIPSRDVHFFNHQTVQQYEQPGPHQQREPVQTVPTNENPPADVHFYNPQYINDYEQPKPSKVKPLQNSQFNNYNQYDQQRFEEVSHPVNRFNSEIPLSDISTPESSYTTTENYKLPSELPPINANLPNMINSLMENDEEQQIVREPQKTTTFTPQTRRPVQRGRRPAQRITTTTQNFENEIEDQTTTRRPVQRSRTRPTRPPNQQYRTSTAVRNPNRVRFNPSNEERGELQRNRGKGHESEKNLEYQRDVLKQNYPVINRPTTTTTSTTENIQYTQEVESESPYPYNEAVTVVAEPQYQPQQDFTAQSGPSTPEYYQNTESLYRNENEGRIQDSYYGNHNRETFQGMEEPLELPQDFSKMFNERKQVEVIPQNLPEDDVDEDRIVLIGDKPRRTKVQPVYVPTTTPSTTTTTTTTTTTEAPTTTTIPQTTTNSVLRGRRPGFIRRPVRPSSTSESSVTTEASNQDRFTIRPRSRSETTTQRIVPQYRGRVRQPALRTTTPAQNPDEEQPVEKKPVYRSQYRNRIRPKFNLETQESQWSASPLNSFQPIENIGDFITRKYDVEDILKDNEPEIITADPNAEQDMYLVSVTPSGQVALPEVTNRTESEKLDLESVPEVENEITPRLDETEEKKVNQVETTTEPKGKRRGVWRRVRVRPIIDTFETAESQHVSQQTYNVLSDDYRGKTDSKLTYNSFTKDDDIDEDIDFNNQGITHAALEMTTIRNEFSDDEKEQTTENHIQDTTKINELLDFLTDLKDEELTTIPPIPEEEHIDFKQQRDEEMEKEMLLESTTIQPEIPETTLVEELKNKTEDKLLINEVTTTTESVFDEVRKSLTNLFSNSDNEESEPEPTTEYDLEATTETIVEEDRSKLDYVDEESTEQASVQEIQEREVRANVTELSPEQFVIATSTSKEVSHETEICYRGRCIKSAEATKH